MCSICGVIQKDIKEAFPAEPVEIMGRAMAHRGPDQTGTYFTLGASLSHNRLAIIDVENGLQPMTTRVKNANYTIIYNGELYNTPELTSELRSRGVQFETRCDTEVVLKAYIEWGKDCPTHLNGIFAFAVLDEHTGELFLARDRFGIKPLYYTINNGRLMFASELKALLEHPDVKPRLAIEGLWELLFLSPVTRIGSGLFKDIYSLEPAHHATWKDGRLTKTRYFAIEAKPFEGDEKKAIETTREILIDAIRRQLVSDVPLCTFLSGGLDSSVVSSVAAKAYKEQGKQLCTYSFEYENNKEFFKKSLFQPQSDDEYASWLAGELGTKHRVLTITPQDTANALYKAAELRDFPGQADIDSSLYLYCGQVRERHTVALSGECADEIFGGYPWFYRSEMLEKPFYPWIHDPFVRASLFDDSIVKGKQGYEWLSDEYRADLNLCPTLAEDSKDMRDSRVATWLSTRYFMYSLLERKD